MSLLPTPEMKKLFDKVSPYLDKNAQLPEDVPEEIKRASERYIKLAKEQERIAYDL